MLQQTAEGVPLEMSGELIFEDGSSASLFCSFLVHETQMAVISGEKASIQVRVSGRVGGLGGVDDDSRSDDDPLTLPLDHPTTTTTKHRCTTSCCRARGGTPPSSSSARATCRRGWTRRSTTRRRRCGVPFLCVENTVCGWWVVWRRHVAWCSLNKWNYNIKHKTK